MLGFGALAAGTKAYGLPSKALEDARAAAKKLKITDVEIYLFDIPLTSPFRIAIGEMSAANDLLVRIKTDQGLRRPRRGLPLPADHRRDPGHQRGRRGQHPRHDRGQGPAGHRRHRPADRTHRPLQSQRRGRLRHGPLRHPGQGRRPAALPPVRRDEDRPSRPTSRPASTRSRR
ncbi:MAG: hypothetical protein M0C28_12575 [Candidatus Moduliflexus flocculans]|nr:hypothetical protein [Candidatus Moduliflexus flocculans]